MYLALEIGMIGGHPALRQPQLFMSWYQHLKFTETSSGAYTITTRKNEAHCNSWCLSYVSDPENRQKPAPWVMESAYVDDADYSDEWILVPCDK